MFLLEEVSPAVVLAQGALLLQGQAVRAVRAVQVITTPM
jgi:hypothetical protein